MWRRWCRAFDGRRRLRQAVWPRRRCLTALLIAAVAPLSLAVGAAAETPQAWLERVGNEFFSALRTRPPRDPAQAQALLERQVLPWLDVEQLGQRIAGDAWRAASAAARSRFAAALRHALPRRYAQRLLRLPALRLWTWFSRRLAAESAVEVHAWLRADGWQVPLRFTLTESSHGWRVADVAVLSFSLSQSLRAELLPALRRGGLDAAARALEDAPVPG